MKNSGLSHPGEPLNENQRKRNERQILGPCRRTKKAMEHEDDGRTNCNWCTWNNPPRINKGTRKLGNKRTSGDQQYYSIVKIDQSTEKSHGEVRRFAFTQTTVRKYLLTLV